MPKSGSKQVDRADFVRPVDLPDAYENMALSIGYGQTISQPFTVAFMLEKLQPVEGDRVLDIGSGSGWTTALLAQIVGNGGQVTGLEIIPELVEFGRKNLQKYNFRNTSIKQAKNGVLGIPGKKFDRILVSAAATTLPEELIQQLKPGGTLVVPVRNSIFKITKSPNGGISLEEFPGFVFVPLT